jgi:hypothetical protein
MSRCLLSLLIVSLAACSSGAADVRDASEAGSDPGRDVPDPIWCTIPLPVPCVIGATCQSWGTCLGHTFHYEDCACDAVGQWTCIRVGLCDDRTDIYVPDSGRDAIPDPNPEVLLDIEPVDISPELLECAPAGVACSAGRRCCDGTVCFDGACTADVGRLGDPCSPERPCGWLSGACRDGICACAGKDQTCQIDSDCCVNEGPCVEGTCGGACILGGDDICDALHPCCGLAGRTDCQFNCSWSQDWLTRHAPGCLDLVWNGATLVPPACTSDDECCPWIGPCVGGYCGACMASAEDCTRDLDCCEGHCALGKCAGHACTGRGLACASDAQCCSPPCSEGMCGCLGVGRPCDRAEECCMGRCVGGACATDCPDTCLADADCCAWHNCIDGRCLSERPDVTQFECQVDIECTRGWYGDSGRCDRGVCQRTCSGYGARNRWGPRCASDGDCCEASRCSEGACIDDCGGGGSGCWDNFQCCDEGVCVDGTCTGCRAIGAPCQDGNECCQGFCDRGFCAKPCIPIGSMCLWAGDCCDGGAACQAVGGSGPASCCWSDGHACATGDTGCCGFCDGTACKAVPVVFP